MDISNVVGVDVGRRHKRRKGRGTGSGAGKTSSRGSKGAASRTGFGGLVHREGGQMPLIRRIPKRGFKNRFRVEYDVFNVGDIAGVEGDVVTLELLKERGLLKKNAQLLKVLGTGEIDRAVHVTAHSFSESAKSKIEAAGGTANLVVPPAPGQKG